MIGLSGLGAGLSGESVAGLSGVFSGGLSVEGVFGATGGLTSSNGDGAVSSFGGAIESGLVGSGLSRSGGGVFSGSSDDSTGAGAVLPDVSCATVFGAGLAGVVTVDELSPAGGTAPGLVPVALGAPP